MELMSSLLLCALTATLPPTLGLKASIVSEIRRDATKVIETPIPRKTVWLSSTIPAKITLKSIMQTMEADTNCMNCVECMKKTVQSLNTTVNYNNINLNNDKNHMPSRDVIMNDVIESYDQYKTIRSKREVQTRSTIRPKKTHQVSKIRNVTVTKYNLDGQIYAIKIRENNTQEKDASSERSCQVYSVKKYHPCDSPKADLIFTTAKRKASKRSKPQTKVTLITSTEKTTESHPAPPGNPRPKGLAEPSMTSIEDLDN